MQRDMSKMLNMELKKIRDYPRFNFHSFAFPNEIEEVRRRLKISKVEFRTKPVTEDGMIVGYNVYIRGWGDNEMFRELYDGEFIDDDEYEIEVKGD